MIDAALDTGLFARALGALFFLSTTEGSGAASMRRTALATSVYATGVLAVVGLGGQAILGFFGITVDDFRVAGGLVLLLIGLGMLNGQENTAHDRTPEERAKSGDGGDTIAFYPMAFPMIVGPGTITTVLIFVGQAHTAAERLSVGLAAALVLAALTVVLAFASTIGHYMSQTLRVITTRVMGMVLAAIAAAMIAAGLKALLPGLA